MGREKNNRESNCVAFDDACFDETNYQSSIIEMDKKEVTFFKKLFQRIFNFGTRKTA